MAYTLAYVIFFVVHSTSSPNEWGPFEYTVASCGYIQALAILFEKNGRSVLSYRATECLFVSELPIDPPLLYTTLKSVPFSKKVVRLLAYVQFL